MKFKTQKLLDVVESEIARRTTEAEEKYAAAVSEYEQAKAEWLDSEHPDELAKAARRLLDKLRKGRTATPDDLRGFKYGRYGNSRVFRSRKPVKSDATFQPSGTAPLENLRTFLLTVADEEVSSTGLRDVGFRNIAGILRLAA